MTPNNLGYVFFTESSKNIGGQELQLLQQMEELKKLGYLPRLYCKRNSRVHAYAIARGLDVKPLMLRNALDIFSMFSLARDLLKNKPHCVFCHSGHDSIISAVVVRLLRAVIRINTKILRVRTYQPGTPSPFPYQHLFDQTYCPSQHIALKILKNPRISPEKISVLYPGIDFGKLDAEKNATLPIEVNQWLSEHPGPRLLHGAMLRGEKGHECIIQAMPQIIAKHPQVRYIIAGEGSDLPKLKSLVVDLGLVEHVFFAGMIDSMAPLIKQCDIALLPSLMEPLGMFQIETQYLEVPTLASNVDGIPETILHEKTGLLIQAGNSNAWAENVNWSLDNMDLVKSWAKSARCFVSDRFSKEHNTRQLVTIIQTTRNA
jgi:glycosyltransferase involved in cell wall biosynthesis